MGKSYVKEIVDRGEFVERISSSPDPWYGQNEVEVYLHRGCYYRVVRNTLSDPKWWSYERVYPEVVQKVVWETFGG